MILRVDVCVSSCASSISLSAQTKTERCSNNPHTMSRPLFFFALYLIRAIFVSLFFSLSDSILCFCSTIALTSYMCSLSSSYLGTTSWRTHASTCSRPHTRRCTTASSSTLMYDDSFLSLDVCLHLYFYLFSHSHVSLLFLFLYLLLHLYLYRGRRGRTLAALRATGLRSSGATWPTSSC